MKMKMMDLNLGTIPAMSDLIERLRELQKNHDAFGSWPIYGDAADEIERLTAKAASDQQFGEILAFDLIAYFRERIAKLEGALNWFRFNSTPEGMARAIEALQEKPDE